MQQRLDSVFYWIQNFSGILTGAESNLELIRVSGVGEAGASSLGFKTRPFLKNAMNWVAMNQSTSCVGDPGGVRPGGPGRVMSALTLAWMLMLMLMLKPAGAQMPPPLALTAVAVAREWRTPPTGDVQRGLVLYQQRCTACHAVDSNKIGPAHRGVVGRRIGSLPGYKYSDELARSRLRWTPQTLNAWLEDPEELVAGQRMGFQVDSPQERADLIAYLLTLK